MFQYMEQAEKTADELAAVYLKASRQLILKLDEIFERYQQKHKLSREEALRILNTMQDKTSLKELKEALRAGGGDQTKAELLAQLEGPAYAARLERLQSLQEQLDRVMQRIYQQEKVQSTSHYIDLAKESYSHSLFRIQQQAGFGFSFGKIRRKEIDELLGSKWSGANYSTRIWNNTTALAQDLKEELLVSLLTGRTERETAEIFSGRFAAGASQARRLIRTESCNLAVQMDMKGYEECGIETYLYVATLDLRTSEACRELDGKRFPVSEQQPGKNCPPMHPWCRSTTICDISEEELAGMKRRARDPKTGKNKLVPANMTYQDWQEEYGSDIIDLTEKEQKAMNQYLSFESYGLNEKLRSEKKLSAKQRRMRDGLDRALKKMPFYEGDLSRSLYFGKEEAVQKCLSIFRTGEDITFPEYISTTASQELYNPDGEIQIFIRNTKRGRNIMAYNEKEQEVLYERGTRFFVWNITKEEGKYLIFLEEMA